MSDLCVKLRNRIILLKSQDMMPEVVSELDQAADTIEQLQQRVGELEEDRDGWKHDRDVCNKAYEDCSKQCDELVDENQALAAHVERLYQDSYQKKAYLLTEYGLDGNACKRIACWIKEQSPQTSLAEHDREVAALVVERMTLKLLAAKPHVVTAYRNGDIGAKQALQEIHHIERNPPQTSLAEVRAKAVELFAESLVESCVTFEEEIAGGSVGYIETGRVLKHANQHANKIRNGKDGK